MKTERGFTLLEVMVALMIVGLTLLAAAATVSQMIDSADTMRDRTYASWIGQNKIVEMRLSGTVPDVSTTSGELDYGYGRWEWRAVVSETGIDNFMRVDVSVSRVDTDYVVRTVTGFIGEPVRPGQANRQWQAAPVQSGGPTG
ncbi:MAG: type II secretion system minor pseudopilin GspI [Proteobacteria bacterium]|nr:type II secretion system minor pseudopilin GspI [Pseudomonadota bacterium]